MIYNVLVLFGCLVFATLAHLVLDMSFNLLCLYRNILTLGHRIFLKGWSLFLIFFGSSNMPKEQLKGIELKSHISYLPIFASKPYKFGVVGVTKIQCAKNYWECESFSQLMC